MTDTYTGTGYTGDVEHEVSIRRRYRQEEDSNVLRLREAVNVISEEVFISRDLEKLFADWHQFNSIEIRTWDVQQDFTNWSSGTVVKFINTYTKRHSGDFEFNMYAKGFQRKLKPNMDRLREEVDCMLIHLDAHNFQRLSGATANGDCQLLFVRYKNQSQPVRCWLCFADQVFLLIENRWIEDVRGMTHLRVTQSNQQVYDINQAIEKERELQSIA